VTITKKPLLAVVAHEPELQLAEELFPKELLQQEEVTRAKAEAQQNRGKLWIARPDRQAQQTGSKGHKLKELQQHSVKPDLRQMKRLRNTETGIRGQLKMPQPLIIPDTKGRKPTLRPAIVSHVQALST